MGVKNLLAKQEAGFISLHDVLTLMTKIDEASYCEAATALHRLLWSDPGALQWWIKAPLHGVSRASDQQARDGLACIAQAAKCGEPITEESAGWNDEIPF